MNKRVTGEKRYWAGQSIREEKCCRPSYLNTSASVFNVSTPWIRPLVATRFAESAEVHKMPKSTRQQSGTQEVRAELTLCGNTPLPYTGWNNKRYPLYTHNCCTISAQQTSVAC